MTYEVNNSISMNSPPSVVLITVDCLRADHLGCYGYDRPTTPHIDAFANESTVYEHSYANSPGTRWALQSIHTGVHTNQIDGLGVPDDAVSLAQIFQQAGYATGGFAKNGFLTRDYRYDVGFDTFVGVSDFESDERPLKRIGTTVNNMLGSDWLLSNVFGPLYSGLQSAQNQNNGYRPAITDTELCSQAIQWIKRQQSGNTPFFAWIHLMDAHTPYARWNDHLRTIRGDTDIRHIVKPHDEVVEGTTPSQAAIDAYDTGIRSADEQIGHILDTLNDDTTVAITGDHGEEFGRYNPFHTASLYSSMTQVPLLVRSPETGSKRITEYPAQHLDIAPTLIDSADIKPPEDWQGESLRAIERGGDEPIYLAVNEISGVRTSKWKLIRRNTDELYNTPHHGDDGEDVATEYPKKHDELRTLLDEHETWILENQVGAGEQQLEDGVADLSDSARQSLEDLGYLEE